MAPPSDPVHFPASLLNPAPFPVNDGEQSVPAGTVGLADPADLSSCPLQPGEGESPRAMPEAAADLQKQPDGTPEPATPAVSVASVAFVHGRGPAPVTWLSNPPPRVEQAPSVVASRPWFKNDSEERLPELPFEHDLSFPFGRPIHTERRARYLNLDAIVDTYGRESNKLADHLQDRATHVNHLMTVAEEKRLAIRRSTNTREVLDRAQTPRLAPDGRPTRPVPNYAAEIATLDDNVSRLEREVIELMHQVVLEKAEADGLAVGFFEHAHNDRFCRDVKRRAGMSLEAITGPGEVEPGRPPGSRSHPSRASQLAWPVGSASGAAAGQQVQGLDASQMTRQEFRQQFRRLHHQAYCRGFDAVSQQPARALPAESGPESESESESEPAGPRPSKSRVPVPDWFACFEASDIFNFTPDYPTEARYQELMNTMIALKRIADKAGQPAPDTAGVFTKRWHEPSERWEISHRIRQGGWWKCRSGPEAPEAEAECILCHPHDGGGADANPRPLTPREAQDKRAQAARETYDFFMEHIENGTQEVAARDQRLWYQRVALEAGAGGAGGVGGVGGGEEDEDAAVGSDTAEPPRTRLSSMRGA